LSKIGESHRREGAEGQGAEGQGAKEQGRINYPAPFVVS